MGSGEVLGGDEEDREGDGDVYHSRGVLRKAESGGELAMPVLTNTEEKLSHSQAYYSWAPASRSRAAISLQLHTGSLAIDSGVLPP